MTEKIVYVNFSEIDTEQSSLPISPTIPQTQITANVPDVSISGNTSETAVNASNNEPTITANISSPNVVGNAIEPLIVGQESSSNIIANVTEKSLSGALAETVLITAQISNPESVAIVVNKPLTVEIASTQVYANVPESSLRFTTIGEVLQERSYSGGLFRGTDDYLSATDSVIISVGFFRNYSDTASSTDFIVNDLNKISIESVSIAEYFAKDTSKGLTEIITLQETVSNSLDKPLATDFYALTDVIYNDVNKTTNEIVELAETINKDLDKNILDTITLSDSTSITTTFSRTFNDTVTVLDEISNMLSKAIADTTTISDITQTVIFTAYVLNALETISISETINKDIEQLTQENVYPTDDILGEAIIDDDQYFGFNKGVVDNYAVADVSTMQANKITNESISAVESGIIYNQGYFADITYVQLYYVGDVRTIG